MSRERCITFVPPSNVSPTRILTPQRQTGLRAYLPYHLSRLQRRVPGTLHSTHCYGLRPLEYWKLPAAAVQAHFVRPSGPLLIHHLSERPSLNAATSSTPYPQCDTLL